MIALFIIPVFVALLSIIVYVFVVELLTGIVRSVE